MKRVPRLLLILSALLSLALAGLFLFGAHEIKEQDRRLAQWVEVEAVVVRSEVLTQTGQNAGSSHIPVVEYDYRFKCADYHSSRVFPLVQNTEPQRAREIVAEHPPGTLVTVRVDPSDPTSAFLLAEPSIFPHAFTLLALLAFEVAAWAGLSFVAAVMSDDGDLMMTVWGGMTALWVAAAVPVLKNAHGLEGQGGHGFLVGMTFVAVGLALLGLVMTMRHWVGRNRAAGAQRSVT